MRKGEYSPVKAADRTMEAPINRLVLVALLTALLSLAFSGLCMVFLFSEDSSKIDELSARITDIEEEHDYLVDQGVISKSARSLPEFCAQLPDPGPCKSKIMRWYYLGKENDCIEFPWGGCQGNNNNFLSLEQCRSACHVPLDRPRRAHLISSNKEISAPLPRMNLLPVVQTYEIDISRCLHPPDSGPCNERLTRYYYENGECKRFEYGGCAGNANNFFTEIDCQRKCFQDQVSERSRSSESSSIDPLFGNQDIRVDISRRGAENLCSLPEDQGDCDDTLDRYRWSTELGECVKFTWSGCGGNNNNFVSKEKCNNRCRINS